MGSNIPWLNPGYTLWIQHRFSEGVVCQRFHRRGRNILQNDSFSILGHLVVLSPVESNRGIDLWLIDFIPGVQVGPLVSPENLLKVLLKRHPKGPQCHPVVSLQPCGSSIGQPSLWSPASGRQQVLNITLALTLKGGLVS